MAWKGWAADYFKGVCRFSGGSSLHCCSMITGRLPACRILAQVGAAALWLICAAPPNPIGYAATAEIKR